MQEKYKFIFSFPPSSNALFGGGSKQRRFPSKEYKKWKSTTPKTTPLKIEKCHIIYNIYYPDLRVRDSKNFLKAIDDWLVHCETIKDDNWKVLSKETIEPFIDRENPRIEVVIIPNI